MGRSVTRLSMNPPSEPDDRSSHLHRQAIGILGLLLPPLLYLVAKLRPTDGIEARWHTLRSVSAYYHTGSVAVFVGVLAALAVFLLTYRGYNNAHGWKDRAAALVAGIAAACVAFFPTDAPEEARAPSWWNVQMGLVHGTAATILFGSFIFFSLFLFTQSNDSKPQADKVGRNAIYVACGLIMLASMVWAIIAGFRHAPIFWPETVALEFFALSWLVKGRADHTVQAVVSRTLGQG